MLVVNPWHWLEEDGSFPAGHPKLWPKLIRIGQFIQMGYDLERNYGRETLLQCRARRAGKACGGWMVVSHHPRGELLCFCSRCGKDEMLISNWADTPWALERQDSELIFPLEEE